MNDRGISRLLDYLRRAAPPGPDLAPDGVLLGKYADARDEPAFELIVRRHGPLVWSAVRRILRDEHAAEDALQATFLALARKANSLRGSATVAGWLYRVAVRIALRARPKVRPMLSVPEADGDPAIALERLELIAVVDEEVSRLPERLRQAVVLCCLGGQSTEEAAQRLGCPRGTILSRLHAAREKLRQQLTRRGFEAAAIGPLLAECGPAPLTSSLIAIAVRAAGPAAALSPVAITLAQGALTAMLMTKVKVAALVVVAAAGLGVGANHWAGAGPGEPPTSKEKPAAARVEEKPDSMIAKLLARQDEEKRAQEVARQEEQHRLAKAEARLWEVIDNEEQQRARLREQLFSLGDTVFLQRRIDLIYESQKANLTALTDAEAELFEAEQRLTKEERANLDKDKTPANKDEKAEAPKTASQRLDATRQKVESWKAYWLGYDHLIKEWRKEIANINRERGTVEAQIRRSELREQLELEKYRKLLK